MPILRVPNCSIAGISTALPKETESNKSYPFRSDKERDQFISTTGIHQRHIAPPDRSFIDYALASSTALLKELSWESEEINFIIVVTQTADFRMPGSAVLLQDQLGFSKGCGAFDINLGCSGYVYGLNTLMSLMANMPDSKGLLVVGDLSSRCISPKDRSTYPLFSDAITTTAVKWDMDAEAQFNLESDGSGFKAIHIPEGGSLKPVTSDSVKFDRAEEGIERRGIDMELHGTDVFHFSLKEVAPNIIRLLDYSQTSIEQVDYCILHQANLLINQMIGKKLKLADSKMPLSLSSFGNTSSASIPVTLCQELHEELAERKLKLVLSGFGVGLSWGSALIETNQIKCLSPIYL